MPGRNVVILDGAAPGDTDLIPFLSVLSDALKKDGTPVVTFLLGDMILAHCLGFSGCWLRTPGMCVEADAGREIARAGLILLAFPLYVDALPYLVTRALVIILAHRNAVGAPAPQRFVSIVNSGFPKTHQNAVALAICREFAAQSGVGWAGGLALGRGGAIGGQPLTAEKRSGPPVVHVTKALEMTAATLAEGMPVPAEAVRPFTKSPIPFMPLALWRWMYIRIGGRGFVKEAAKNGVSKAIMLAQPYAARRWGEPYRPYDLGKPY